MRITIDIIVFLHSLYSCQYCAYLLFSSSVIDCRPCLQLQDDALHVLKEIRDCRRTKINIERLTYSHEVNTIILAFVSLQWPPCNKISTDPLVEFHSKRLEILSSFFPRKCKYSSSLENVVAFTSPYKYVTRMFQEKFYQVRLKHIFSRFRIALSHARSSNIIDVIFSVLKFKAISFSYRGVKIQLLEITSFGQRYAIVVDPFQFIVESTLK